MPSHVWLYLVLYRSFHCAILIMDIVCVGLDKHDVSKAIRVDHVKLINCIADRS